LDFADLWSEPHVEGLVGADHLIKLPALLDTSLKDR